MSDDSRWVGRRSSLPRPKNEVVGFWNAFGDIPHNRVALVWLCEDGRWWNVRLHRYCKTEPDWWIPKPKSFDY